jgi:hypothetical protein
MAGAKIYFAYGSPFFPGGFYSNSPGFKAAASCLKLFQRKFDPFGRNVDFIK